jgi:hypothetical protein
LPEPIQHWGEEHRIPGGTGVVVAGGVDRRTEQRVGVGVQDSAAAGYEAAAAGTGAGVHRSVRAKRDGQQRGGPVLGSVRAGVDLAGGASGSGHAGQVGYVVAAFGGPVFLLLVFFSGCFEGAADAFGGEVFVEFDDSLVEVGDLIPLFGAFGLPAVECQLAA